MKKLLLAALALSLTLSGCGWHHRHHGHEGHSGCKCSCPSCPQAAPAPAETPAPAK